MQISKKPFFDAASKAGIPLQQIETLWNSLDASSSDSSVSNFAKLLYYFGALIVILAMTWFLQINLDLWNGAGMFFISLLYAAVFVALGSKLWNKKDLRIPAGLLITMAVCMTPLAIYGLETFLEIWPKNALDYNDFYYTVKGSWIFMDLGTIVAGLIALRFFHFPFITAPIFYAAWFLTMDLSHLILGNDHPDLTTWLSLCFGIVMLVIAYVIHRKNREDYAFWGYLFGALTFWGNLSTLVWDKGELVLFIYLLINLLMMLTSIFLKQKIFMILGVFGVFGYLTHLVYVFFKDSTLFPFALSVVGLIIIYLGVLYQKNHQKIEESIYKQAPQFLKNLFPK